MWHAWETAHTKYCYRNLDGRDHQEDLVVDRRIILRKGGTVDWIHLAQDKDQWRTLMNTVMNLRVP
jgi:hypothetical protein